MKLDTINDSPATSSGSFSDPEFLQNSFKNGVLTSDLFSSSDLDSRLKDNRKSYYDNHKLVYKDEFLSESNNSSELETNLNSDYSCNYHEFDVEAKSKPSVERDDFDDLIDLTHRVPRKLLKKNSPTTRRKSPKPSSLPPLPPLPYSFVKLERTRGDSNLILNKKEDTKCKKSVTRLIMPVHKCENKKFEPDKHRQSDVVQEWDQISKIFASLESLLNDVVSTTDRETSSRCGSESFQRSKASQSHRAMSEHNLKPSDEFITFSSISRANNKKLIKKLINNKNIKDDDKLSSFSSSNENNLNSFHLNMKKFKYFELSEYLSKLKLGKYEFKFLTNGFDDLVFLNNVLTLQDLVQMGIDDYNDIFTILNEIKKLPSKIRRIANEKIQFNSVSEWLNYLNLNEYVDNFTNNNIISLEMAKSLWEIELSTVLQIPLLGHRKRIINSIKYMLKHENTSNKTCQKSDDETDIEYIDEEHLFKSKPKSIFCNFKQPDELIYSSSSSSSKSSESSSSPPLSCSSRQYTSPSTNSDLSSKLSQPNRDQIKMDKIYSNSLLELNKTTIKNTKKGEAFKKRNCSLENHSPPESARSNESSSPKAIWKNDPQNLIKGSFNFVVNYLGSSAITRMKTNEDPVKATIDRLKNTAKNTPYPLPKIELAVSINGVKLLNVKNKETLFNYDIKHINNVCQDQDDMNYFAFSTQSDPSAHYYCHVFSCKDKDLSTQVILTIGQAFDVAFELFCKNNFN